jgi:hypothetical protein
LVYIHTGLSLFTLYTETINIHLPIWRLFKPCSRQHPHVIDDVHSNVIFNGLSATSALPTSLPGAVKADVDVIFEYLRASLRAAGADDSVVDLMFTNFKAAPVGVSEDWKQRRLHLRLAVAKRLSLAYAHQDHMDINTCVVIFCIGLSLDATKIKGLGGIAVSEDGQDAAGAYGTYCIDELSTTYLEVGLPPCHSRVVVCLGVLFCLVC